MAANLRHVFAHCSFPRQFSKYFLYKYIETHSRNARGRLFSMLAMRRGVSLAQNTSFNTSNFVVGSRFFHVGSARARSVESSGYDDPEFVTEEFSLWSENVKDVRKLIS
jgi:hypothetical protein